MYSSKRRRQWTRCSGSLGPNKPRKKRKKEEEKKKKIMARHRCLVRTSYLIISERLRACFFLISCRRRSLRTNNAAMDYQQLPSSSPKVLCGTSSWSWLRHAQGRPACKIVFDNRHHLHEGTGPVRLLWLGISTVRDLRRRFV